MTGLGFEWRHCSARHRQKSAESRSRTILGSRPRAVQAITPRISGLQAVWGLVPELLVSFAYCRSMRDAAAAAAAAAGSGLIRVYVAEISNFLMSAMPPSDSGTVNRRLAMAASREIPCVGGWIPALQGSQHKSVHEPTPQGTVLYLPRSLAAYAVPRHISCLSYFRCSPIGSSLSRTFPLASCGPPIPTSRIMATTERRSESCTPLVHSGWLKKLSAVARWRTSSPQRPSHSSWRPASSGSSSRHFSGELHDLLPSGV